MKVAEASLANPCGADWRAMTARGGRARLCGECKTLVHDLSSMTEPEARALLQRPRSEGLCIRYLHDANGNVWFGGGAPEPLVSPRSILRNRFAALAGAMAVAVAPAFLEACGGANPYDGASADDGGTGPRSPASPSIVGPELDASPDAMPDAIGLEASSPDAGASD